MSLSPEKAERYQQNYIISGVRQGLSGAAILRTLQAAGLGYRTENFYADYNYYKSVPSRLPYLSAAERSIFLPDTFVTEVPSRKSNAYIFTFAIPVNYNNGLISEPKYVSITSETKITPDIAFNMVQSNYGVAAKYGSYDFENASLYSVRQYYTI